MGTNCLIWCGVVLLVADDQHSSFMTNGHLPPVGARLSFVCGSSFLRMRLAKLAVSRYSGNSISPTWLSASYGGTRLSVLLGSLRFLYLNSLGVPIPILSNQRNEYDWCVMNKIIEDKQCTILWHFDDLNKSNVDPAVISSILADIVRNMVRLQKWPSRGEKCINTSGWPLINPHLVR